VRHDLRVILTLAAAAMLAAAPTPEALAAATAACERDLKACAYRDQLQAEKHAADLQEAEVQRKILEAEREAALERVRAEEAAEAERVEALRKSCGRDYMRVRVGMRFAKVERCAGPFSVVAEDERGAVYEAEGGLVRVEHGKVVRLVHRP
jgi:membrane-bound lytic murein transglycosylase B